MTRDASLDEFLGGGDDEEEDEDEADAEPEPPETGEEEADASEEVAVGDEEALDEAAGEDPPDEEDDADAPDTSATEPPLAPADVEPARSTYDWSPDGAECAACGATVEARWRDESGLVCADCKAW